jgi:hypothetical protein
LLHPAHTLRDGSVSFAAGTSGRVMLGELARADDARERAVGAPGGVSTRADRANFARGALARFAVAPGVAPFFSARVGLGDHNEAGLGYTGRTLRLDGRHAFEWQNLALSLGLVGLGALSRAGDQPPQNVDDAVNEDAGLRSVSLTSLRGYGLELPVLFGYRSSADVVLLWAGLRGGIERDTFDATLVVAPDEAYATSGDATHWWAGGLVGFGVGLPPIQVRVELDAAYESAHGNLLTGGGEVGADVAGWSLTPAAAISAKF